MQARGNQRHQGKEFYIYISFPFIGKNIYITLHFCSATNTRRIVAYNAYYAYKRHTHTKENRQRKSNFLFAIFSRVASFIHTSLI